MKTAYACIRVLAQSVRDVGKPHDDLGLVQTMSFAEADLTQAMQVLRPGLAICAALACCLARAGGVAGDAVGLDAVTVMAARGPALDGADSATIGTVYAEQFEHRPLSRPGELLEVVPGLIITQHSGEGKANQYFLRGFNLDHGTDFASFIDGMPVNLPTHAHGQGYSDANFLVPELVDSITYRKGPYYAEYGDFSAAGAVDLKLRDRFDQNIAEVTGGLNGYVRPLLAGSYKVLGGDLLYAVTGTHYDGAYVKNDNFNNGNGLLRYSRASALGEFHLTLMGYSARFDSTDQIPQRAVDQGLIGRLDCFDGGCGDGGKTHRFSLSGGFTRKFGSGEWIGSAYAFRYKLDLYSNFTYYLLDPQRGDQFEQVDARNVYGGRLAYKFPWTLFGLAVGSEIGVQTRYDDIGTVGLYATENRVRLGTQSEAHVRESGSALYAQSSIRLAPWLTATPGARIDYYHFDVLADNPRNTGTASKAIVQPKLTLVAGPFSKTEFFLNLGKGFHSNDARGTTITEAFDPRTNVTSPVDKDSPLVATRGADFGIRSFIIPQVQLTQSVFILDIGSELTFSGDAANTEAGDATRRYGSETSIYWRPIPSLVIDADYAYSHSRFRVRQNASYGLATPDAAAPLEVTGFRIPESATSVFALGATYESSQGWFAGARLRYFGPRPLIEDGSVRSHATQVVNIEGGYALTRNLKLSAQIINLLNSRDHDIDYFFPSRLTPPGAAVQDPAEGVNSIHFHPIEPINVRVTLRYRY